jgi:hypothetical protein
MATVKDVLRDDEKEKEEYFVEEFTLRVIGRAHITVRKDPV